MKFLLLTYLFILNFNIYLLFEMIYEKKYLYNKNYRVDIYK